ncbi:hypothetical protein D778_00971 [Xanthomarina gelatinilytica]|uniref:Uncharacterized protein n=1 Tax=Xanthomarina gelatinilytica TaxID=1137281 RepID=M7MGS8_9FLAO|nr:hypothetical protein D778_00971 [Xanthomarina gelatinilytica]
MFFKTQQIPSKKDLISIKTCPWTCSIKNHNLMAGSHSYEKLNNTLYAPTFYRINGKDSV